MMVFPCQQIGDRRDGLAMFPVRHMLLLIALLLAAVVGCGTNKTGTISGVVTFQGKPMPGGFIHFYSIAADGKFSDQKTAPINNDGTYSIAKVPVGDVRITVQAPPGALEKNVTEKGGLPKRAPPPVNLPPKYQSVEQTDLKYTVMPGNQKHDLILK